LERRESEKGKWKGKKGAMRGEKRKKSELKTGRRGEFSELFDANRTTGQA
jgi:hypothetical protein